MRIVNFIANPKDGVIKIPKEYLKKIEQVHVIMVLDENETPKRKKKKHLTAMSVKTKGLKIDREEVYENN